MENLNSYVPAEGNDASVFEMLAAHKRSIRATNYLRDAQIVVITEAQYDLIVVAQIYNLLKDDKVARNRRETIFMTSNLPSGTVVPGVVYHKGDKKRFLDTANDFLDADKVMITNDDAFFVTQSRTRHEIIRKFRTQLLAFDRKIDQSANPGFTPDKVTYTGKDHGADDLAMAFQLAVYWSSVFMWSPTWTSLVPGLPRSTLLSGARHNSIICKQTLSVHPGTQPHTFNTMETIDESEMRAIKRQRVVF